MSGTFGVGPFACQYLVVAGGGSGGGTDATFGGAGGGAGGYLTDSLTLGSGVYSVIVGAGGASSSSGNDGIDSTFSTIVATGGRPR